MTAKIVGVMMVIAACGGIARAFAMIPKREILYLRSLTQALALIRCELEYRLAGLPQLCTTAGKGRVDLIGRWFDRFGQLLCRMEAPDISSCEPELMAMIPGIYPKLRGVLHQLCQSLGRYDLSGQLEGIDGTLALCKTELQQLSAGVEQRSRMVQTLGLCAGTALAIVLL